LSLTDKYYYQIKGLNAKKPNVLIKIFNCIKMKIILFFIFTFIMFIFYWYIITCFCVIYINTQSALIKDSFSSFGLGLIYPFILYIFPAFLRLFSLRYYNGKLSPIYKTSDIIPFF